MASVFSLPKLKNIRETAGEGAQVLLILGLVLAVGVAVAVVGMTASLRNFATAAGVCIVVVGAFVSGNPRLFCLWGLAFSVPLTLSKRFGPMFIGKMGGEDSFRLEISDLFLFPLAGFLIWDILTGRSKGIRIPKVTFFWLMLVIIGSAWVVAGPWRTTAAQEVVRMLKVTVLFLVVTNELKRPGQIRHCVAGLMLVALAEAVIALIQYQKKGIAGLEFLGETTSFSLDVLAATSVQGEAVFRPSGLLQHANLLGVFLAVSIPFAIGMLMISKGTISRVFFLLVIAAAMPAEVVALSRSAWVSATLGVALFLFFLILHPGLRWRSVLTAIAVCVIGMVVLVRFFEPITQRLLRSQDDASIAREVYKADARNMIDAAPWVGHGLNSYVFELKNHATLAIETYGSRPPAVHHIFYLWWAETGIGGMLLFCAVWGSIIWTGITNLTVRDESLFVVNAAGLAAMIALIPDSFLSFTLRVNTTLRAYWLVAGMIFAIHYLRLEERAQQSTHEPSVDSMAEPEPLPHG